jgi:isopentenyl diphosphate isomerase/L-lactate dehydrogenase-like FMN-dependent dehydrogenase
VSDQAADLADLKTIDQLVSRAREVMESHVYGWAAAGAGQEVTTARNAIALNRLALVPRMLNDVSEVDTRTSFLGVPLELPVLLAPVGALVLYHPDGGLASGKAAAQAGTSSFCSILEAAPWEDVAATSPGRHFFQLYVLGDRSWLIDVVERVDRAGFAGLCVTVDSPVIGRRDRNLSDGYDWNIYGDDGPPNLMSHGFDPENKKRFTWADLQWLCRQTRMPVILKGVLRPDEAVRAVESGVVAIYVSNHGGRAVDHSVSTIEVLGEIVDAIDNKAEVIVDSGFVRGVEICKALALGARAVGIGKLQCWALALGGAAGLIRLLEILHQELLSTMTNLGCRTVTEITRDHVRWSIPARSPGPPADPSR